MALIRGCTPICKILNINVLQILYQVSIKYLLVCYKHIVYIYRYTEICCDICKCKADERVSIKNHINMKENAICYTIEEDLRSEFYALYKELGNNVELAKKVAKFTALSTLMSISTCNSDIDIMLEDSYRLIRFLG